MNRRRRRQKATLEARRAAINLYAPSRRGVSERPFNPVLPAEPPPPAPAHDRDQPRRDK